VFSNYSLRTVFIAFSLLPVANAVVKRQHHTIGSSVTVKLFNEVDDNTTHVSSVQDTLPVQELKLLPNDDLDPLIFKCMKRDATRLLKEMKQLNFELEVKSDRVIVKPTKPVGSEWPEACKKQIIDLINSHFEATTTGVPEGSLPEMTELLLQLKDDELFDFKLSKKSTVLHVAGSRGVLASFIPRMKEVMDKYVQSKVTYELSHSEFDFMTQVIMQELKTAFPKLIIESESGRGAGYCLHLKGSVSDIKEFEEQLTERKCHRIVHLNMPASLLHYYGTRDGQKKLNEHIRKRSIVAGLHVCRNQSNKVQLQLLCKPPDLQPTQRFADELRETTGEIKVTLSESFLLVRDELTDFQSTCDSLQAENNVQISRGDRVIIVSGFKSGLKSCAEKITGYIKANSMLKMDCQLPDGVWKLFNTHMKNHWDEIQIKAKQMNVTVDPSLDVIPPCVSLSGEMVNVTAIMDTLTLLKSTVQKSVIPMDRPGSYDLFTSEKGRLYMDGIEMRARVAIVTAKGHEGAEDSSTGSIEDMKVDVDTKCTASVNNLKIHVSIGDITQYQADVIVNAANENLQHSGGVARAIAQAGGAVIQEDSTRHVRKSGQVDCGCSWLTTTTGNLPCKALVHAVGPRWSGGKQKEEALLYKTCITTLERSKNYRSIVFPAISSGIYGFPIKLCADTMVRAAIDFSRSNHSSSLQKITFIIQPSQAQQCTPFVATLKSRLPADKVFSSAKPQVAAMPLQKQSRKQTEKDNLTIGDSVYGKVEIRQGGILDVQVRA
jgi:poly [ADP-ribose] polymerase 10/14/15